MHGQGADGNTGCAGSYCGSSDGYGGDSGGYSGGSGGHGDGGEPERRDAVRITGNIGVYHIMERDPMRSRRTSFG